jgi:hypothetical protein
MRTPQAIDSQPYTEARTKLKARYISTGILEITNIFSNKNFFVEA